MESNDSSLATALSEITEAIKEVTRPKLFFDIAPRDANSNLLDVILRNSGWSAAYNINCIFDPDLPYYDNIMLSDIMIFRNLPFLEPQKEIRFFFKDLVSIVQEGSAYGPKKTSVTVTYKNTAGQDFTEKYIVDLERYKGLLSIPQPTFKDQLDEIKSIRRTLERIQNSGLITKTLEDVRKERRQWEQKHLGSGKTSLKTTDKKE